MKFVENAKNKAKKIAGYLVWLLAALLLISTFRNISRVAAIRSDVEKERQKLEKIKAENASLEAQIAKAQSSGFIEQQLRDKLGLVKEGEVIVVLPDEDTLRKLAPPQLIEENTLPDPNWKKWEKLFF
jgi:cell division protein FtsB